MKSNILCLLLTSILLVNHVYADDDVNNNNDNTTGTDSDADDVAAMNQRKEFKKFLSSFQINFEGSGNNNSTNTFNSPSVKRKHKSKPLSKSEKKLEKLAKKVFGHKHHHKKRKDRNGNEVTYYKDYSVPIMFRKVIAAGGDPLPKLNFAFKEGKRQCRCSCKLQG